MIILICLFIILHSLESMAEDNLHSAERDLDYLDAERRHQELMELYRNKKPTLHKTTRRRLIQQDDITIGEEVTEEYENE